MLVDWFAVLRGSSALAKEYVKETKQSRELLTIAEDEVDIPFQIATSTKFKAKKTRKEMKLAFSYITNESPLAKGTVIDL